MSLPRTFINITVNDAYALMVNAGIDMFMLSSHKGVVSSPLERLIKDAKRALLKEHVLESKLNDAVMRILAVKMAMGLIKTVSDEG
jgi:beta-glucosidase